MDNYVRFMRYPKTAPSKPMMTTNMMETPPPLLLLSRLKSSYAMQGYRIKQLPETKNNKTIQ